MLISSTLSRAMSPTRYSARSASRPAGQCFNAALLEISDGFVFQRGSVFFFFSKGFCFFFVFQRGSVFFLFFKGVLFFFCFFLFFKGVLFFFVF